MTSPTPTSSSDPDEARRPRSAAELRERKALTQERIVHAAMALFATRGYERASITAIAARAGVSRAAVFWHFTDKESLFREAFARMLVPFFEELKRSLEHVEPRQRLFDIFDAYERVVSEHQAAIGSFVRWTFESERLRRPLLGTLFQLHDELMSDFKNAFTELAIDPGEAEALAAAVIALLDGNLLLEMLDPEPRNRERRRVGLRRLTERMLGPPHGG
jgi:AcrR family transcriptional regulator